MQTLPADSETGKQQTIIHRGATAYDLETDGYIRQMPSLAGAVAMAFILGATGASDIELVSDDEVLYYVMQTVIADELARRARQAIAMEATRKAAFYGPGAHRSQASRDKHGQYRGRGEW